MLPEDLLSSGIIETALQNDQGENVKLISFTVEDGSEAGNNYFNVVKRVNITYSNDGIKHDTSYLAKVNPCKPNDSFNAYRRRAMQKEIFFYTKLIGILNLELKKVGKEGLKVPKYLNSCMTENKEVIVLEDLRLKGFETFSKEEIIDECHIELMVKEITKLHVASHLLLKSLGSENLEQVYPLLTESWLTGDGTMKEAFEQLFIKGINHNISLTKALEEFQDLIPWMEDLKSWPMERLLKELYSTSPWQGICHGDLHRTNVMFKYGDSRIPQDVVIIDWQTFRIANPSSEFNYLSYSLSKPERDQFFQFIIKTYFETYFSLIGPDIFFTAKEFEQRVRTNYFGLLICFYLVPLSRSVGDPSELFEINEKDEQTISEDEIIKSARAMLKSKQDLASLMIGYLKDIYDSNLWKSNSV